MAKEKPAAKTARSKKATEAAPAAKVNVKSEVPAMAEPVVKKTDLSATTVATKPALEATPEKKPTSSQWVSEFIKTGPGRDDKAYYFVTKAGLVLLRFLLSKTQMQADFRAGQALAEKLGASDKKELAPRLSTEAVLALVDAERERRFDPEFPEGTKLPCSVRLGKKCRGEFRPGRFFNRAETKVAGGSFVFEKLSRSKFAEEIHQRGKELLASGTVSVDVPEGFSVFLICPACYGQINSFEKERAIAPKERLRTLTLSKLQELASRAREQQKEYSAVEAIYYAGKTLESDRRPDRTVYDDGPIGGGRIEPPEFNEQGRNVRRQRSGSRGGHAQRRRQRW